MIYDCSSDMSLQKLQGAILPLQSKGAAFNVSALVLCLPELLRAAASMRKTCARSRVCVRMHMITKNRCCAQQQSRVPFCFKKTKYEFAFYCYYYFLFIIISLFMILNIYEIKDKI